MVSKTRRGAPAAHKLQFHDKLVGHSLSADALQKKLKLLHTELAGIDQDNVDTDSLSAVRKDLISTSILLHKDKGVKAYAACCLADLLRLYAPDAPYTAGELKDIFQFFSRQLHTGLKAPDGPHFTEYYYLLESLSNVKSIVLVCDLPQADDLVIEFFRNFFDIVRHDIRKNLQPFLSDILVALVDECNSLPQEVLEVILSQFQAKSTGTEQAGYRLAVAVCNAGADKLQRNVSQHFTESILQQGHGEDMDEIQNAHNLIKELNRSCPTLLLNVIPQLEEELRVDDLGIRLLATETLGDMFSDKSAPGYGELARKYPSAWRTWLSRQNDKANVVRIALVQATKGILAQHPDLRADVEETLRHKLLDPDEKVRTAACRVCSQLEYETIIHHLSLDTLKMIGGRVLDKKRSVRMEAAACLGRLFKQAHTEIEAGEPLAISQLSWIPNALLHTLALPSPDIRTMIESVLLNYVLPLPGKNEDEGNWTDQLMLVLRLVDNKALNALLTVAGLHSTRSKLLDTFVSNCVAHNGGVIDGDEQIVLKKLRSSINQLSAGLPEPLKASDDLMAFANMNDSRCYKLLRTSTEVGVDLKTMVKSREELSRRVEEAAASALPTLELVWQKFAPWVVNVSSIPGLVRRLQRTRQSDDETLVQTLHALLSRISKNTPDFYKPHISELMKVLSDKSNLVLTEICLQALSAVFRSFPELVPSDRRLVDKLTEWTEGDHPRHAKFAVRLLACSHVKAQVTTTLVDKLTSELSDADPDRLVTCLSGLSELAFSAPDAFERASDSIMTFVLKDLLLRDSLAVEVDDEDGWVDDADIPQDTRAKLLATRLCVNRCLAHASSDHAGDVAQPVINLLFSIVETGGVPFETVKQSSVEQSRMRLQAATSLLKLSVHPVYDRLIGARLSTLALVAQDPCFGVRLAYITKLAKYGSRHRLAPRYNVIPFLTAHDPESEVRDKAKLYVVNSLRRLQPNARVAFFEVIFVRLLHLLAHHPDFSPSPEDLTETVKYIDFYLELVCTAENIPLLWHLAVKLKTVADSNDTFSDKLYTISELAQHAMKRLARVHSWSISSHPAKVEMPGDIFVKFKTSAKAADVQRRVFLPDDVLAQIHWGSESHTKSIPVKRQRPVAEKKPAAVARKARTGRTKRRKRAQSDDEDSVDSSPSSGDDGVLSSASRNDVAADEESDLTSLEGESEQLGRGARTKAKAKAAKRAKKMKAG